MSTERPNTEIVSVVISGTIARITLRRPSEPLYPPIAPANIFDPTDPNSELFPLHRLVDDAGPLLTFETDTSNAPSAPLPKPGGAYLLRSWWDRRQLGVAKIPPERWVRRTFVPGAAISFRTPGGTLVRAAAEGEQAPEGAELVESGWDHEHCALCWQSISDEPCDQPIGFTDGSSWLCAACHAEYIASGLGPTLG